jgi:hypothetical protein
MADECFPFTRVSITETTIFPAGREQVFERCSLPAWMVVVGRCRVVGLSAWRVIKKVIHRGLATQMRQLGGDDDGGWVSKWAHLVNNGGGGDGHNRWILDSLVLFQQ